MNTLNNVLCAIVIGLCYGPLYGFVAGITARLFR